MGTLTADCPRLDAHCPHKLATSCRLTSTLNCCACADERPHSRTYRVYIDGVGFVQRGTRWQSYCWFCKEFWNNRLAATDPPLEISHTQIPQIPDQTEFLERWFEFHQGYRLVRNEDGSEQRIAVIGEPFGDVSPGFLPRTLDQLRRGRTNDALRAENRFRRRRLSEEDRTEEPHTTIEDALDDLLENASDEEEEGESPSSSHRSQSEMPRSTLPDGSPRPWTRNETMAQRARERFARVFGTREEVEQDDYVSPLASMYTRAWQRHQQAEDRRASGNVVAPALEGLPETERRDIEQQILWGVIQESQRAQLGDEGTQGELHTVPNPYGQQDPTVPDIPELESREVDLDAIRSRTLPTSQFSGSTSTRAPPSESMTSTSLGALDSTPSSSSDSPSELRLSLERINEELVRIRSATDAVSSARFTSLIRRQQLPAVNLDLDNQPNRPPPLKDEEMVKSLACQVCYSQLADIAVLPCGHMVMCEWCADTIIPVKHSHIPLRPTKCPVCRKSVKQRFKIHM